MYDDDDNFSPTEETGSDELLAADNLRLPADANILVRLHALRAWLTRRSTEGERDIGSAALDLQAVARTLDTQAGVRPRRHSASSPQHDLILQRAQQRLAEAQRRHHTYDEARELLEECVAHTTTGTRLLVEYYLALEERLNSPTSPTDTPWVETIQSVLHRVEQLGIPGEDEE